MSELKVIHEEVMCCGYKRCPTVKIFEDGSMIISDDDEDRDSVGTIRLRPEAAERFRELFSKKE